MFHWNDFVFVSMTEPSTICVPKSLLMTILNSYMTGTEKLLTNILLQR